MSPRATITATFFLNGAIFSAWYARLPAIQADLGLSEGEIGLALLGAPAGLFAAQPVVGALAARRGSRVLVRLAPVYMVAVALPALAVDLPTLLLAVAVVGAANGALDIAMNAQGLVVERRATGPIFASLHAAFSFGALAGAAAAGAFAAAGVEPLPHLLLWAGAGAVAAALLSPGYVDDSASGARNERRLARPSSRLAVLGTIAFVALLAEGAVFDWSGIYLARETGAADGVAALGLAVFSLTMGLGRLTADPLTARLGAAQVARAGAALAAVGLAAGLVAGSSIAGIVAFAVMGLGLASVFPLTLRAAGTGGAQATPDLAAVSAVGYTGFLAGPPLIGLLSELVGLAAALSTVSAGCLVAALLAGRLDTLTLKPAAASRVS